MFCRAKENRISTSLFLFCVMEGSRTPYNSIYEALPASAECAEPLVCCTHGKGCDIAARQPNEEVPKSYVNLAEKTRSEKEREQLIDSMKKDLQFTDFFARRRTKKNRKESTNKEKRQQKTTNYQVPDDEIFPRKDKPKSRRRRDTDRPAVKDSLETTAVLASQAKENTFQCVVSIAKYSCFRLKEVYLGACTFSSAELNITKQVGFRLYHRLPSLEETDDLEDQAHLYMVCRNGNEYRHYPVKARTLQETSSFYVDYGDPRTQAYPSLDELVCAFQKKMHFFESGHPAPLVVEKSK